MSQTMPKSLRLGSLIVAIGSALTVNSAIAQESGKQSGHSMQLEEVVVTARRREESLQRVPVSIGVVTPEELALSGINSAMDLGKLVPGLSTSAQADRNNINFSVRGQSLGTYGAVPSVVPYFAEVPLQRLSDGQFFDIENIQVLKGPQGTLFGRVTTGGNILITPVKPSMDFEGYAQGQIGNDSFTDFEGAVNFPVIDDKLAVRMAGKVSRRDGYTKNIFDGRDLDNISSEAVRLSVLFRPLEYLENTTIVNYNHSETNGTGTILLGVNPLDFPPIPGYDGQTQLDLLAAQQARGPRHTQQGKIGPYWKPKNGDYYDRDSLWVVNTTIFDINDTTTLKNIFGYQYNQERIGVDLGGASTLGFNLAPEGNGIGYREQYSEELQLQGALFDGRVDYTVGAYFEWTYPAGDGGTRITPYNIGVQQIINDYDTTSEAVYGQIGVEILDGLKFNAGLRRTADKIDSKNASYFAVPGVGPEAFPAWGKCLSPGDPLSPGVLLVAPCTAYEQKANVYTYTLALEYQLTPDLFSYISLRQGYRQGGINSSIPPGATSATFDPEIDNSLEVGIKSEYGTDNIQGRTNVAAYYDEVKGVQRDQYFFIGDSPVSAISNLPRAEIKGFELLQTVYLYDSIELNVNWSHLDAKYDKGAFNYTQAELAAACPADPLTTAPDVTLFCPKLPLPLTPKDTVTASISYRFPLERQWGDIVVRGEMYYTAKTYQTGLIEATGTIPSYDIYNASISWQSVGGHDVDLTLFGTNITDKTYLSAISLNALELGNFGVQTGFYGPPRMIGLIARYGF